MAKRPSIPCGHCGGTGAVELPEPLRLTLAALSSKPRTVAEVHAATGRRGGITAEANRCAALRRLGLAQTTGKRGKSALWVRS